MRGRNVRKPSRIATAPVYRTRYTEPKKPIQIRNIVRPIFYVFIVSLVFWWIFLSGFFTVKQIDVKGNRTVSGREVAEQLTNIMNSSILGKNIIFINTNKLAAQFADKHPQLSGIKIKKKFLNKIEISLTERQASLIWKTGNNQFVLSEDGRAYSQWSGGSTNLLIVTDGANLPVTIGQQVVPASFIVFTRQLISRLNEQKIAYSGISVPETTSEVYITTKDGYILKLDTTRSVDDQIADLKAVIALLAKQKNKPKEYIDLRISGKVFYK